MKFTKVVKSSIQVNFKPISELFEDSDNRKEKLYGLMSGIDFSHLSKGQPLDVGEVLIGEVRDELFQSLNSFNGLELINDSVPHWVQHYRAYVNSIPMIVFEKSFKVDRLKTFYFLINELDYDKVKELDLK